MANNRNLRVNFGTTFSILDTDILTFSDSLLLNKSPDADSAETVQFEYTKQPLIKAVIKGPRTLTIGCGQGSVTVYYESSGSVSSYSITSRSWEIKLNSAVVASGSNSDISYDVAAEGTYIITLTISDAGGYNDDETFSLVVNANNEIQFTLDTGSGNSFQRSANIKITPIFTSFCNCVGTISYQWTSATSLSSLAVNKQSLRIPSKTLAPGTHTLTLTVTCTGGTTVTGSASVDITITSSPLVAFSDKSDQIITDQNDFLIRGKDSYDPDGDIITFSWAKNGVDASVSSNQLILFSTEIGASTSNTLLVTLTISGTFSRTASKTHLFTIEKTNPLTLSIAGPAKKVGISTSITLKSRADYVPSAAKTSAITYQWSTQDGAISGATSSNYVIKANTLTAGSSYTFIVTASNSEGKSVSGTLTLTTNSGTDCDNTGELTPATGPYTTATQISFKVSNCVDKDNEDYPLTYKYSIRRGSSYSLLLSVLATNTLSARKYPKAVTAIKAEVCDTMADCKSIISEFTISSASRHLKVQESTLEDYESNKVFYDLPTAVIFTLMERVTDEALLDLMWNDLVEYESGEFVTRTTFEQLASIVLMFIDQPQLESLAAPRIPKYISYLNTRISMMKSIYDSTAETITFIAERLPIVDNSEEISILALNMMTATEKLNQAPGSSFTQSTAQINVVQVVDLQEYLVPIALGSNEVILRDSGLEQNANIRIIAGSFSSSSAHSDIIQLSVTSSSYNDLDDTEDYEVIQEMNAKNEGCIIVMKYSGLNKDEVGCASFDGDWVEENCKVISSSDISAKISVSRSGTYKIVKKGSQSESHIYPNLYLVISIVILCALAMPFMIYVDKNTLYLNIPSQSATSRSGLEGKFSSEYGPEYLEDSIFSKHLLISMFINARDLPRSEKLLIIVSNIVLGILIQSAMLENMNIHPALVGVISAIIVLPFYLMTITLLRFKTSKLAKILRMTLAVVIMSVSIVGVYMLSTDRLWYVAFISGLATEFILSQSIVMGVRHVFNF